MGVREAAAAMSRGGLLSLLNMDRAAQAADVLKDFEPNAIAAFLHDMSGPFNFRLLSTDVDSRIVHSADKVSSFIAMAIAADVLAEQGAGKNPQQAAEHLIEAFCAWIDTGNAVLGAPANQTEAGKVAALMAESAAIDSLQASNTRMLAVARFAAALGTIGVVLRVPQDLPTAGEKVA